MPREAGGGAVYLEGIVPPTERLPLGVPLDTAFEGFTDGAQAAREHLGI